jgi:hypothetical protein
MGNLEKLAIYGTIDEEIQNKNTTQHNMCWTLLGAKKHKLQIRSCLMGIFGHE